MLNPRKGTAIVETAPPGGESSFYMIYGNNDGDIYAALSIRKMSGRIIAFKSDQQVKGSNIYPIGKRLNESDLIEQGFKILTTIITHPGLELIPAFRPQPNFNASEANRLLKVAQNPTMFYNHIVNPSENYCHTIDASQLSALFAHLGYEISDDISEAIQNAKIQDIEEAIQGHLSPELVNFMQKFAEVPKNIKPSLIYNADQILLFDLHKAPQMEGENSTICEVTPSSPKMTF